MPVYINQAGQIWTSPGGAGAWTTVTGIQPLVITTTSPLVTGSIGIPYATSMAASGGVPPYTWSLVSSTGTNSWTVTSFGSVTGTPISAETDSLIIQVTDSALTSTTGVFGITIVVSNDWTSNLPSTINIMQGSTFDLTPYLKNAGVNETVRFALASQGDGVTSPVPNGVTIDSTSGAQKLVAASNASISSTANVVLWAQPTVTLLSDYTARANAAISAGGWAQRFLSSSDVGAFRWTSSPGPGWDPNPAPGSIGSYVRWNSTDGIMGNGCLELEQLSTGNMSSYWWRPFDPTATGAVLGTDGVGLLNKGPGQGFYVQLRFKTNCAGTSGTGSGLTGRKQWSFSRSVQSYLDQELVCQDNNYRAIYQMYQGLSQSQQSYSPLTVSVGSDINLEPGGTYNGSNGTTIYCSYNAGSPYTNCWPLTLNTWQTFLTYIVPSTDQTTNGSITVWGWIPGMSGYIKIFDMQNLYMKYDPSFQQGFNALLLWIYETNRTGGPAGQKQWYDQVIFSPNYIACPAI